LLIELNNFRPIHDKKRTQEVAYCQTYVVRRRIRSFILIQLDSA
jgi:hypothetical protein